MGVVKRFNDYYIDYRYMGRRIMERVGPQKRLAEELLARRKTEIAEDRFQVKRRRNIRFDAFAKVYLDYAQTNKRSWVRDEFSLRKLTPFFGNRLLSDISPFFIESYKKKRVDEVKPATVNREIALLKRMFNLAIKWGRATTNPMKDVRLFREENLPERILSKEEIAKLLTASTEYSKPIVLTAIHTGMRIGEILSLKWDQVNLQDRVITILHSKNGKARKIPIDDTLWKALNTKKEEASSEYVFFCDRTGGPIQKFRTAWYNALRKSGIPHARFHDLRHNFASHLVAAGVDIVTVKELLGHANLLTTSRYAHSAPETKRQALALLNERLDVTSGSFLETKAVSA